MCSSLCVSGPKSNTFWQQFTFPVFFHRKARADAVSISRKRRHEPIKLIYIHVLRYLVGWSKGLCNNFWPLFALTGVNSSSVVCWFVALLLSLKFRVKEVLLTRQDAVDDRWLFPFRFLVQCCVAAVVDCNKRLSDVVMLVSSFPPGTVRLLLLNEFIVR